VTHVRTLDEIQAARTNLDHLGPTEDIPQPTSDDPGHAVRSAPLGGPRDTAIGHILLTCTNLANTPDDGGHKTPGHDA
jgi:hypothetical protein